MLRIQQAEIFLSLNFFIKTYTKINQNDSKINRNRGKSLRAKISLSEKHSSRFQNFRIGKIQKYFNQITNQCFFEQIIAVVLIGIVAYYLDSGNGIRVSGDLFFLIIIVTFFICTVCLFISEWIVWSAVDSYSKSMFVCLLFIKFSLNAY